MVIPHLIIVWNDNYDSLHELFNMVLHPKSYIEPTIELQRYVKMGVSNLFFTGIQLYL